MKKNIIFLTLLLLCFTAKGNQDTTIKKSFEYHIDLSIDYQEAEKRLSGLVSNAKSNIILFKEEQTVNGGKKLSFIIEGNQGCIDSINAIISELGYIKYRELKRVYEIDRKKHETEMTISRTIAILESYKMAHEKMEKTNPEYVDLLAKIHTLEDKIYLMKDHLKEIENDYKYPYSIKIIAY